MHTFYMFPIANINKKSNIKVHSEVSFQTPKRLKQNTSTFFVKRRSVFISINIRLR